MSAPGKYPDELRDRPEETMALPRHRVGYETRFSKDLQADGFDINDCLVTLLAIVDPPDGATLRPRVVKGDTSDLQISLAESLVIRAAHPVYNVRMD